MPLYTSNEVASFHCLRRIAEHFAKEIEKSTDNWMIILLAMVSNLGQPIRFGEERGDEGTVCGAALSLHLDIGDPGK